MTPVAAETTEGETALITMPFASFDVPSLTIGMLKSSLGERHLPCRVHYFNLAYAQRIGHDRYLQILPEIVSMLGSWLFSADLFRRHDMLDTEALAILDPQGRFDQAAIMGMKEEVPLFLEACVREVLSSEPRIVAFPATAQVYQQQVSSLALARRIKEASPQTTTVVAGECFEGIMGLETLRQFSFVDVVVSGETELILPRLLAALLREEGIVPARGVYTRHDFPEFDSATCVANTTLIQDLDALPVPDHSDYFEQRARYEVQGPLMVTFETARGCWWTSRSDWCKFCSLHGQDTQFRSKSQARALQELRYLVQTYNPKVVWALDFVLNRDYFSEFIPQLAHEDLGVSICYEVRPDLTKQQIRLLADAGIDNIQVGVESFSTNVLRNIKKGVSGLHNVQFLKWAREFGIHVRWNILFGLPSSGIEDYEFTERLFPLLSHLGGRPFAVNFVLQRYSPYYRQKDRYFTEVKPAPAYTLILRGLASETVENLAYNFEYRTRNGHVESDAYRARLTRVIESHTKQAPTSTLCFWEAGDTLEELVVLDLRPIAANTLTRLGGLARFLYKACDSVQSANRLYRMVAREGSVNWKDRDIDVTLEDLVARGIMAREDNRFIALALPLSGAWVTEATLDRIVAEASKAGLLKSLRLVAENRSCAV